MLDQKEAVAMQERGLRILSRHPDGFKFTNTFFHYTSHEIGSYYAQSGDVMCDGEDYVTATRDMGALIKSVVPSERLNRSVISGGQTRDWIFSKPVALQFVRPHVMIYEDGKTVGASMKDKEVIHVADLNNEGSSPRDKWVPIIRKAGGTIREIFFYVDRMEGGVEVMKELGLERYAVVPLDDHAWDYLQSIGTVSPEIYKQLKERGKTKAERDAWAHKILKTNEGLETLAALVASQKTFEKAKGVINIGYPEMKQELTERLKKAYGRRLVEGL